MYPNVLRSSQAAARTDAELVTSPGRASALPPEFSIPWAISFNRLARRAKSPTAAPRRANSRARPRPIPEDAPVMRTTLLDQLVEFMKSHWYKTRRLNRRVVLLNWG